MLLDVDTPPVPNGAYPWESIDREVLGVAAAAVTFTPAADWDDYIELRVRIVAARQDGGAVAGTLTVRLNGDTDTNNHRNNYVQRGGALTSDAQLWNTAAVVDGWADGGQMAAVIDIDNDPNAATARPFTGFAGGYIDDGATKTTLMQVSGGAWLGSARINAIRLAADGTGLFVAGSTFTLEGRRG